MKDFEYTDKKVLRDVVIWGVSFLIFIFALGGVILSLIS